MSLGIFSYGIHKLVCIDHMAIIGENHMVIGLGIQTAYSDEGIYRH